MFMLWSSAENLELCWCEDARLITSSNNNRNENNNKKEKKKKIVGKITLQMYWATIALPHWKCNKVWLFQLLFEKNLTRVILMTILVLNKCSCFQFPPGRVHLPARLSTDVSCGLMFDILDIFFTLDNHTCGLFWYLPKIYFHASSTGTSRCCGNFEIASTTFQREATRGETLQVRMRKPCRATKNNN